MLAFKLCSVIIVIKLKINQREQTMKTIKVAVKAILTIERPSGEIEKVEFKGGKFVSEKNLEIIKAATYKANGSKVLSVENISVEKTGGSLDQVMRSNSDKTVENMSRMGE